MPQQLIQSLRIGIINYVKEVEGLSYKGPSKFNEQFIAYIEQSTKLESQRKDDIKKIIALCDESEQQGFTSKVLIHSVVSYTNNLSSFMEKIFRKPSRFQLAIFNAIAHFDASYILVFNHRAVLNEMSLDEPVRNLPKSEISHQQFVDQLHYLNVMVEKFMQQLDIQRQQIITLSNKLEEKVELTTTLKEENRDLRAKILKMQVALLSHRDNILPSTTAVGSFVSQAESEDKDQEETLQFPYSPPISYMSVNS